MDGLIKLISQAIGGECENLQVCLQGIYNLIASFAVALAFIMFLIGAFKNLLSTIPDVKLDGKRQMKNSLIGLVVIFLSGIVLYWINPEIFRATLIIYRVEFSFPQILIKDIQIIENMIRSGKGIAYNFNQFDNKKRCQEFFDAIDDLVEKGVGARTIYDLTKYKLNGQNLTEEQVKALLKALLISESGGGGHDCDPRNWGRGNYAFATFGIEYTDSKVSTRNGNVEAYNKVVKEAKQVFTKLKEEGYQLQNLSASDFTIDNLKVGGKLDNPYLITALAIKRLSGYDRILTKEGLGNVSKDIIAVLLVYKGGGGAVREYLRQRATRHTSVANIIATIQKAGEGG